MKVDGWRLEVGGCGLLRPLVLGLLLWLTVPVMAQQPERTLGGRTYLVHTVEAGQTLYAISRAYAVPVQALLEANPSAEAGLSIGQEVLVPRDAVDRKEARKAPALLTDGELRHTVARRETLFGIARTYGVAINDLLERNPELNTGLREGMEVIIPVAKVAGQEEAVVRPAVEEEWVEHTVLPGETLFGLGQRYNVLPARIEAFNEIAEGLKAGMVLRIPVERGTGPVVERDTLPAPPLRTGERYRMAVLPPFAVDRNDSLLQASTDQAAPFHEPTRIAAQFTGGVLIALDTLQAMGLDAEVLVMDMGEEPKAWNAMLKRPELKDVDLFIGPFHRTAIEQLARTAPQAHIVCPVPQSNKVILGHPTVSKVTGTRVDLVRHTGRYVAQRHGRENVILVKPEIHADRDAQAQMQRALNEGLAGASGRLRDSVLVVRTGRSDLGSLVGQLAKDKLNVLVVPSDDVEFVTTLVTKLKPLTADHRILLVGLESWLAMETVALPDLDALAFHYASASFVDHTDPRTQAFVRTFRERYNNDVDEYAFLGYDIALYYGTALLRHGRRFPQHFAEVPAQPLHLGFRLSQAGPENGFRNEHAVMLHLRDLQVVKAP